MNERITKWGALSLGLLGFVALLLAATFALYDAPRLEGAFVWNGSHWLVERAPLPLVAGDQLQQLGSLRVNSFTFLVDNSSLSSSRELFNWLAEKDRLYVALCVPSVAVLVKRQNQEIRLELPVVRHSWIFLSNPALVHLPVAIAFFLVGWATYQRPRSGSDAFWFYLMCLSMSLVYVTNVISLLAQPVLQPTLLGWVNLLNLANFVLGPTLLVHFALLIPRPRANGWMLAMLYLPSSWMIATMAIAAQGTWVPTLFLATLLVIAQAAWSYRGALERQQMKWIGAGFLLGIGPWLALNGIPLFLFGHRLMSDTLPGAFLIFIPLGMAVAIHRYRLFDVGTFLEGTAVYLLTLIVLVLCELAILTALGLSNRLSTPQVAVTALLAGTYGTLRVRLAYLVNRWFHRARVSNEVALDELRRRTVGSGSQLIPEGLRQTVQQLLAPLSWELLTSSARPGAELELQEPPTVLLSLGDVALRCGPLPAGRHYTSSVVEQLDMLAKQAALYYQNACLYESATLDRQRRLEEREKLLGDLHDGVGSALANIRLLTQEPRVAGLAGDALFELQNFLYDGPDYTLDKGRFIAELRGYGQRLFEEGQFVFFARGEVQGTLPRALALSLFRLVREALSNCLHHAEAHKVSMEIHFGQEIRLHIQDDGRGLVHSTRGRGLEGIDKRVADLGGEVNWVTDRGTRLEVRIPL